VVDLEVDAKGTDYMVTSRHRNGGQNHNIKMVNKSFKMWQSLNIL